MLFSRSQRKNSKGLSRSRRTSTARKPGVEGLEDRRLFSVSPPDLGITSTIGSYSPAQAQLYLRNSNTAGVADNAFSYGATGDVPLVGDWNGDGVDTVGVYRPGERAFYLRDSNTAGVADNAFSYGVGATGDVPLVGDWNGDGVDTVGVYRPATAQFYLRNSNTAGRADLAFVYGNPGWSPLAGHWSDTSSVGMDEPPPAEAVPIAQVSMVGRKNVPFKQEWSILGQTVFWLEIKKEWSYDTRRHRVYDAPMARLRGGSFAGIYPYTILDSRNHYYPYKGHRKGGHHTWFSVRFSVLVKGFLVTRDVTISMRAHYDGTESHYSSG